MTNQSRSTTTSAALITHPKTSGIF